MYNALWPSLCLAMYPRLGGLVLRRPLGQRQICGSPTPLSSSPRFTLTSTLTLRDPPGHQWPNEFMSSAQSGCVYIFFCFTLQHPVFRPWDTREVSTVAKLRVLWRFVPWQINQSYRLFCCLEIILDPRGLNFVLWWLLLVRKHVGSLRVSLWFFGGYRSYPEVKRSVLGVAGPV